MSSHSVAPFFIGSLFLLVGCAVPSLESQFEHGPTVSDVVNHINCELKSIITKGNDGDPLLKKASNSTTDSNADLIQDLTKYHFVASVLMTLDVLNSESANPTVNFVTPLYNNSAMFNSVFSVGASLTGSQERNIGLSYSIDLDKVLNQCNPPGPTQIGLTGDLGLRDIVTDGMRGLETAKVVNIYGNAGPTAPTFTAEIGTWTLRSPDLGADLILHGSITYSPSTSEPQAPGTVTLTGVVTAADPDTSRYLVNLSGTTYPSTSKLRNNITLSGNLTQERNGAAVAKLGFSPKLTLGADTGANFGGFQLDSAVLNVDATTLPKAPTPPTYFPLSIFNGTPGSVPRIASGAGGSGAGGGGGGGGSPKGGSSSSGGGTTQFSSQVVFTLSYGISGGPTWSIRTFKGPAAGSGPLASVSRTDTDTLSITFVAACRDHSPTLSPQDYWQSLPECDRYGAGLKQAAAAAGAFTNQFMQFR